MGNIEDISDVLATLHDGMICECSGTYAEMEIKVSCDYLARYVDANFEHFYVKLYDVKEFCFQQWSYIPGIPDKLISDFVELAAEEIELLYTKIVDGQLIVDCTKGVLFIKATGIELFDQARRPLQFSELYNFSEVYWRSLRIPRQGVKKYMLMPIV